MPIRLLLAALALPLWAGAASPPTSIPFSRPKDAEKSPLGRVYEKVPDRAVLARGFKFAVLDPLMDKADDEKKALVDRVVFETRRAANTQLVGLGVMTKESMVEILQATPEGCEDGECAAKTGQRVGADYIVDGKLRRSGALLEVELRLWRVNGGTQDSTILAAGASADSLLVDLKANLPELLKPMKLMLDLELASAHEQVETRRAQAAWDAALQGAEQRVKVEADARARQDARERQLEQGRLEASAKAQAAQAEMRAEQAAAPRRSILRKVGWTTMGLGVAGGLAAMVGAVSAKIATDKIKTGHYAEVADMVAASNTIPTLNQVSVISSIAGSALLVTGLGLVLFNQDPDSSGQARLLAGPNGLMIAGRF